MKAILAMMAAAGLLAAPALAAKPKRGAEPVAAPAPPPPPPVITPSVRNGVDLWNKGDWAGAVAMWQPFANGGDPDAMFNIGQAHKLGRAVPRDPAVARDWYRKAALANHRPAQANLGILLFQNGEKAEAVRWLKTAADAGEMRAQYVLGVAHWNGDGAPRSLTLAYAYLARAAAQGLPEATTALGNLTPVLSAVERANGWEVASSLAAGKGVPAAFLPGAAVVAAKPPEPVKTAATKSVITVLPADTSIELAAVTPAKTKPEAEAAKVEPKPETKPAATKPKPEKPAPGWRVQLGAFAKQAQAEASWAKLRKEQKQVFASAKPIYEPGINIIKLQTGPFKSRAEARDACTKIAAAGPACFVTES